jgi:hypothetical protein
LLYTFVDHLAKLDNVVRRDGEEPAFGQGARGYDIFCKDRRGTCDILIGCLEGLYL